MSSPLARRLGRCRLPASLALALTVSAVASGFARPAHADTAGGRLLPGELHQAQDGTASGPADAAQAEKDRLASRTRTEKTSPATNADTRQMVRRIASTHGLPPELAEAVVTIESRWNPRARSHAGAIGLMQIKYATARGMGYGGSVAGLYEPRTNLTFGLAYLAGAHKLAGGDICGTILRYHAGHGATRMGGSSRSYCARAKQIMADSGWKPGRKAPATPDAPDARAITLAAYEPGGLVRPVAKADAPAKAVTSAKTAPSAPAVTLATAGQAPDDRVIRPAAPAKTGSAATTDTLIGSSHTVRARKDGWVPPQPR